MYDLDADLEFYTAGWDKYLRNLSPAGAKKLGSFLELLQQACENNPEFKQEIDLLWNSCEPHHVGIEVMSHE